MVGLRQTVYGLAVVCLTAMAYCVITLVGPAAAEGGETLYNGIELPDQWPPNVQKLTLDPMPVPYLDLPPTVIPIDVGRQLFVDDFLIDSTTCTRTLHKATWHPASPVVVPDREWESPAPGRDYQNRQCPRPSGPCGRGLGISLPRQSESALAGTDRKSAQSHSGYQLEGAGPTV